MDLQSRRRVLGTAAGATTILAAGCLDALPLVGDDDEIPAYSEWLPDEGIESVTYGEVAALEAWPEDVQTDLGIDELLALVPLEGVEALVTIEGDIGPIQVFTGSFDPDTVTEELQLTGDPDEMKGDYELYGTAAVGPDAVLFGSDLGEAIDAKRGETARLADEDEAWHAALAGVLDAPFAAITSTAGTLAVLNRDDVGLRSLAIEGANGDQQVTVRLFYDDAEAASADVDDLEADLADAALFQDVTVERDDAVVVVEGTVAG